MNEYNYVDSNLLVLSKKTKHKNVFSLSIFHKIIARLNRQFDSVINLFTNTWIPYSFGLFNNSIASHPLVIESNVIYIHWVNSGMLTVNGINEIIRLNKPTILFAHDMWHFSAGCHQSFGGIDLKIGKEFFHIFGIENSNKIIFNIGLKSFLKKNHIYKKNENVHFVAPSVNFYNSIKKSNIINQTRVSVISNALDTDFFKPKTYIKKDSKIKILYGAMGFNNNKFKGWNDFLFFSKK